MALDARKANAVINFIETQPGIMLFNGVISKNHPKITLTLTTAVTIAKYIITLFSGKASLPRLGFGMSFLSTKAFLQISFMQLFKCKKPTINTTKNHISRILIDKSV